MNRSIVRYRLYRSLGQFTMPSGHSNRPFYTRPIVPLTGIVLVLLSLLIYNIPWGDTPRYVNAVRGTVFPPVHRDSTVSDIPSESAAPEPVPVDEPVVQPEAPRSFTSTPPKSDPPDRVVPEFSTMSVSGRVDSWEDWNSSFTDTATRTYSAIFDSARLDTLPGGVLIFSATGKEKDFLLVRRVFCTVDSVKQLVKYTFPGQSVDFGIGVGFAAGVSLRGALRPQDRSCNLQVFTPEGVPEQDDAVDARNQFTVVLNSTPGYAYRIRTGIECTLGGGRAGSRIYYTRPATVEFRRMVRFSTLARDAGDTVYILTANPRAIEDLSKVVRRSVINALFVPSKEGSEAEALRNEALPNVRLHVSRPRTLDQSFVVLNDTVAIVERNILDPEFKHTVQLKLHEAQMNRIGYPRVTSLCKGESAVLELRYLFLHYDRLVSQ
jgi:hypothetical protein